MQLLPTTARLAPGKFAIVAAVVGAGVLGMVAMHLWQNQHQQTVIAPPPLPALYEVQGEADTLQQLNLKSSYAGLDRRPPPPPPAPKAPPGPPVVPSPPPMFASREPAPLPPPPAPVVVTQPAPVPPMVTPQVAVQKAEPAPVKTVDTTKAAPPAPKKKEWGFLAQGADSPKSPTPKANAQPKAPDASHLVNPAVWAIPQNVNRTLYRSQVLPCELLQTIDSDAPGQVQFRLTVPIYGYYGQGEEIFPKDSKVIGKPTSKPEYGDKTIAMHLEEVQLPSGAIVEVPGDFGNEDMSNGLKGKVNNHWDKVFISAFANALVSLGGGYLVGTPGRGQYYQDPSQKAMEEATRSVQQDTKTIIGRELKRGPSITRDPTRKGERWCTIQMLKNVQFSDKPQMIKQTKGD